MSMNSLSWSWLGKFASRYIWWISAAIFILCAFIVYIWPSMSFSDPQLSLDFFIKILVLALIIFITSIVLQKALAQKISRNRKLLDRKISLSKPDDGVSSAAQLLPRLIERQKNLLNRLKLSTHVIRDTQEAILISDENGIVVDVNIAFEALMGYKREDVIGLESGKFYLAVTDPHVRVEITSILSNFGRWRGIASYLTKAGATIDCMASISKIRNDAGGVIGHAAVFSDITELSETKKLLEVIATTDALTGFPNQLKFNQLLSTAIQNAQLTKSYIGLLFIDIDHFKKINDTLGHQAGDELIRLVASALQAWLGKDAVVCRRSGDEFTAFVNISEDLAAWKSKLQSAVCERTYCLGEPHNIQINVHYSAGVAIFPLDALEVSALYKAADDALLVAKSKGKNRVQFYAKEFGQKTQRRNLIESRLREAINTRALQLVYQPQVNLITGKVECFEALCRWQDGVLGDIAPDEFIPIAEEVNLIGDLAKVVVSLAWEDFPRIQSKYPLARIAVNFTIKELSSPSFTAHMLDIFKQDPNFAEHFEFEITERIFLEVDDGIRSGIDKFREAGASIAIDDFGVGHSSLTRLHQLPIDKIKLDKYFSKHSEDVKVIEIVRSIQQISKVLQVQFVVEGVETKSQCDQIMSIGCEYAQGYFFGMPKGAREIDGQDSHEVRVGLE